MKVHLSHTIADLGDVHGKIQFYPQRDRQEGHIPNEEIVYILLYLHYGEEDHHNQNHEYCKADVLNHDDLLKKVIRRCVGEADLN